MAIAFVQASTAATFSSENSKNLSLTVTAGNTIVVYCAVDSFAGATTITVNDGTGYSVLKEVGYHSTGAQIGIYYLQNVTGGAKTIGITLSRLCYGHAIAAEFSGLGTVNIATDVPLSATATSTTPATGSSATLSQANMLILAEVGGDGTNWSGMTSPSTGYNNLYNDNTGAFIPVSFDYKIVSATTAVSAAWGTVTSSNWGAILGMIPQSATTAVPRLLLMGVG